MNGERLSHKPFLTLASDRGLTPPAPEPDRSHVDAGVSVRRRRVVPSWQRQGAPEEREQEPESAPVGELVQLELPAVAVATETDNQETKRVAGKKRRKNLTVEEKRTLIHRAKAVQAARAKKLEPPETTADIAKAYGVGVSYVYNLVAENKAGKVAKKAGRAKATRQAEPKRAAVRIDKSTGDAPVFAVRLEGLDEYIDRRINAKLSELLRRGVQ